MSIKRKLILSTILTLSLFAAAFAVDRAGDRLVTKADRTYHVLEKEAFFLEMMFRGVNETILTEGTHDSIRLAKSGLEGFSCVHRDLALELAGTSFGLRITGRIDPLWERVRERVPAFLRTNEVSYRDEATLVSYGELLAEGEELLREVRSIGLEARAGAERTERGTRYVMAVLTAVILISLLTLHVNIYRSIAVPINRLKKIMTSVSGKDASGGLEVKVVGESSKRDLADGKAASGVSDIRALFAAYDSMIKTINSHIMELKCAERELETLATTDRLTQTYNRFKFDSVIRHEMEAAKRSGEPLSIVVLDIDHFKRVNDTYGHIAGDYALKAVADIVRDNIRTTDRLARWGGEEFIIIAPNSDLKNTESLAWRIKDVIENHRFDTVGRLTVSFGVTGLRPDDTVESFIKRGDEVMYRAKDKGRNRVESA